MLAGAACIKTDMREANRSGARFGWAGPACLWASAVLAMFHPREALPLGGTIACELTGCQAVGWTPSSQFSVTVNYLVVNEQADNDKQFKKLRHLFDALFTFTPHRAAQFPSQP